MARRGRATATCEDEEAVHEDEDRGRGSASWTRSTLAEKNEAPGR